MPRTNVRAARYAEAAFEVAQREGALDAWLETLDRAAALFGDRLAENFLTSPTVPADRKRTVLARLLPDLPRTVDNFLALLARRDRLELIPEVAAAFRRLVNEHRGVAVARVTTAIPLDERQRQTIAARLTARTGRRVTIEAQVDPSILGGVVAQIGDDVIDGSIRGRLERIRKTLLA